MITWEYRRPKSQVPRWLEGARLASRLLDTTDPGYRYWKPENVQCGSARISNTIIVGRAAILALPMTPLNVINTDDNQFGWLLHGTKRRAREIHGGSGFSPKLLHMFAQITHLAAKMAEAVHPYARRAASANIIDIGPCLDGHSSGSGEDPRATCQFPPVVRAIRGMCLH